MYSSSRPRNRHSRLPDLFGKSGILGVTSEVTADVSGLLSVVVVSPLLVVSLLFPFGSDGFSVQDNIIMLRAVTSRIRNREILRLLQNGRIAINCFILILELIDHGVYNNLKREYKKAYFYGGFLQKKLDNIFLITDSFFHSTVQCERFQIKRISSKQLVVAGDAINIVYNNIIANV
jgi:hypothetical protein